jgi:hypothetical protein
MKREAVTITPRQFEKKWGRANLNVTSSKIGHLRWETISKRLALIVQLWSDCLMARAFNSHLFDLWFIPPIVLEFASLHSKMSANFVPLKWVLKHDNDNRVVPQINDRARLEGLAPRSLEPQQHNLQQL